MALSRNKSGNYIASRYRITPVKGRVAVLVSGGLDSSVLLAECAEKYQAVYPLYLRSGLRWERGELRALKRFIAAINLPTIRELCVLDVPMSDVIENHWSIGGDKVPGLRAAISSNYIPGRNLSLLSKAALFCALNRIGEIALATLKANPFPDAQPDFFATLSHAIELGTGLPLSIRAPYLTMTKSELIKRMPHLPLGLTVSCIRPRGIVHCGACTKCAERAQAFKQARVADPTKYAKAPV